MKFWFLVSERVELQMLKVQRQQKGKYVIISGITYVLGKK